jgi:putative cell wall-binding protein
LSKINRHPVRRTAAGVLAGALALSGAVAAGTPAFAATGFALERVQGNDRYETSAAIAAAFGNSTNIILASGESGRTPDALAANFLAGVQQAPVLLTRRDTTPEPIMMRLEALRAAGATTITVVGGPVAISEMQVTALGNMGFTVNRVAGANRFETAVEIAEAGEGATASNVALLASGVSTIDALAGGPLAYKGRHPLFLTTRDSIPGATLAGMRAVGITSVIILGGEAVVGADVVSQLAAAGITVRERLAGANRSETSVAIANRLIADFGFSANTFNLASGINEGMDALGGGAALSGKENRVLLVTNTPISAAPVTAFATARAATLTAAGRIFGGEAAVGGTLETDVETAGAAPGNFQTLNVTPTEALTLQLADDEGTGATEATSDNRSYTVTGLNNATTYRITLVNAASIQGTGTDRTFLSSAITGSTTAFAVNTGADIADIVGVNGAAPTFATGDTEMRTTTASPVAGNITFEIDGTAPGTVVPAVYLEGGPGGTSTTGGTSPRLETSATAAGAFAAATETFGLGGPTTFNNSLAAPAAIDPAAGTGANSNDITVTVPVTGNVDSVVIQRATVTGGTDETATGEAGPYATVTTINVTAADVTAGFVSFTDQDLDPGVYRYRAAVVSDGQQSAFSAEGAQPNEEATAPATA